MFGCCSAYSLKYISTEGLVDLAVLKKHFGETTELLEGQKGTLRIKIKQKVNPDALTDDEMSMVFAGQELPEKTDRIYPLCTCSCHVVGTMVMC